MTSPGFSVEQLEQQAVALGLDRSQLQRTELGRHTIDDFGPDLGRHVRRAQIVPPILDRPAQVFEHVADAALAA